MRTHMTIVAWGIVALLLSAPAGAGLVVANGNFETPNVGGTQVQNIPSWFDGTGSYQDWVNPASFNKNGTQVAAVRDDGFLYQSLGRVDEGNGVLSFSFEQSRFNDNAGNIGFAVRFYAGNPVGTPADGTAIASLGGLTQIGSTVSVNSLANAGLQTRLNSGQIDLSGVVAGTQVWMEIRGVNDGVANPFAPIDNINLDASVPEPATMMLLGLAAVPLGRYVRRRRQG